MKRSPILLAVAICLQLIFSEEISGQQRVIDVAPFEVPIIAFGDSVSRYSHTFESRNESPKISKAPIIGFGLTGFLFGGLIGSRIDPGPDTPGEFGPIFSKAETIAMLAGTAAGGTFGYLLAKRDLKKQMKRKRQE